MLKGYYNILTRHEKNKKTKTAYLSAYTLKQSMHHKARTRAWMAWAFVRQMG